MQEEVKEKHPTFKRLRQMNIFFQGYSQIQRGCFQSSTIFFGSFHKEKNLTNNVIFPHADKRKTVIALCRYDYISKILDFVGPNFYNMIQDPTNKYQKGIIESQIDEPSTTEIIFISKTT